MIKDLYNIEKNFLMDELKDLSYKKFIDGIYIYKKIK